MISLLSAIPHKSGVANAAKYEIKRQTSYTISKSIICQLCGVTEDFLKTFVHKVKMTL